MSAQDLYYQGRPLSELTRDELIDALLELHDLYRQVLAEKQHEREVLCGV